MRLNVFIIKKQHILLFFTSIVLFISMTLLLNIDITKKDEPSIVTMSNTNGEQAIKKDLNGDGKDDLLYIASKNGKYYVEANIKDQIYPLNTKKSLNTLGYHYNYWPMNLNLIDLSRDKLPEVIVQSSQENSPLQHIFIWNNNEFKNIYSSTNNVIGVLDSKNNKTPKLFSFTFKNGISTIENYMLIGNELKNISYENYQIPGIIKIETFIDLIERPYVLSEAPNIFTQTISTEELSILWKLDKDNFSYSLEDCFFTDTKWDKDGKIENLNCIINFKKLSKNNKLEPTKLNTNLELIKSPEGYLINSIKTTTK